MHTYSVTVDRVVYIRTSSIYATCIYIPCVCVRREKNRKKKYGKKIRLTHPNTPRNSQQPGDRVQLETACEDTRPTR